MPEPVNVADDDRYSAAVFDAPIDASDAWVHGGFWQSARAIFKELKSVVCGWSGKGRAGGSGCRWSTSCVCVRVCVFVCCVPTSRRAGYVCCGWNRERNLLAHVTSVSTTTGAGSGNGESKAGSSTVGVTVTLQHRWSLRWCYDGLSVCSALVCATRVGGCSRFCEVCRRKVCSSSCADTR